MERIIKEDKDNDENCKPIFCINSASPVFTSIYFKKGRLKYEGFVLNNQFHGKGTLYWAGKNQKKKIVGIFHKGKPYGMGTHYSKNGVVEKYGFFVEGTINGPGSIKTHAESTSNDDFSIKTVIFLDNEIKYEGEY